ncbi:arsenite efflux transporter metallochaperone ArsD [Janthinobacterium rivuli]|jgi:hypothetical protein|uniref:arsenite efflux transporter metallochaperone ArsD n=1 Tax=Janthinobacterium sp. FT68W TaxID=2654255 RepID=UPI0012657EB8|nr:arsenite efflux transporter metallochaperone ArsD [Janthinobacterium sp. FT68W]KAB8052549.1 arsenite efflux transporter metallochaperone ArsD [Janthinobacterium sp. FT68W]
MTIIQVFDPAMCCSSGVCGVNIEPQLLQFSADADWARLNGVQLERYNLAQQPMAFADNVQVKRFLERSGADSLPLILVDGEIALAGRYPQRAELARWAGVAMADTSAPAAGSCCGGKTC